MEPQDNVVYLEKFEVGDVVGLKSGGFEMVVTKVKERKCSCAWHDETGEPHEKSYPVEALTHTLIVAEKPADCPNNDEDVPF